MPFVEDHTVLPAKTKKIWRIRKNKRQLWVWVYSAAVAIGCWRRQRTKCQSHHNNYLSTIDKPRIQQALLLRPRVCDVKYACNTAGGGGCGHRVNGRDVR